MSACTEAFVYKFTQENKEKRRKKMLKKLKKNKKKGFTLVELIVVLVILAILAALLIPTLTGYIDKAKEKSIIAETRQTVMAAQTITDEVYADASTPAEAKGITTWQTGENAKLTKENVAKLAEVNKDYIDDGLVITEGKVTTLVYKDTKINKTCTYTYTSTTGKGSYEVK